ncbi:MAG: T9SS type A sorting domain-containing protein, partial [Phaeodactylibacter sp.]|nr:T9SS type A sorting domain-containing protein [Phaeodactylibacter sp.]
RVNDSVAIIDHYQGGQLIRTTDMGTTWTALFNNYFVAANKLQVLNDSLLFYKANDALFKSTDAGLNWALTFLVPAGAGIDAYHFPTMQLGYVVMTNLQSVEVYKTTNGGNDWSQIALLPEALAYSTDVLFENELDGWLVNGKDIFKTADGGVNWGYHQTLGYYPIRFRQFGDDLYIVGRGVAKLDRDASSLEAGPAGAGLTIYPNPTTGLLYLKSLDGPLHLTIYNAIGQPVFATDQVGQALDLTALPSGIYLLQFSDGRDVLSRKVLKQ